VATYEVVRRNFTPAAVGSNETTTIYAAAKGERVIAASAKIVTAAASSTSSTVSVGDSNDDDGYVKTTDLDLESAAGTIASGTGAYFGTTAAGRLYTSATNVQVKYTANTGGATAPTISVALVIVREWPRG
jgi:hypothetical protein